MKTAYAEITKEAGLFKARIAVRSGTVTLYPEGYTKTAFTQEDAVTSAITLLYDYCASTTSEAGGVRNLTDLLNKGGTMEKYHEKRPSGAIEVVKNERAVPE